MTKKQFCVHGHSILIYGRNKYGQCIECIHIKNHIDPTKDSRIKQFCPKNHDTFIYGRAKDGTCKECLRLYVKQYNKIHRKDKDKKDKNRKKVDVDFKLACNLRSRLNVAIKNGQKEGSAVKDLGCSVEFLKQYIESKFHDGMTWGNWGKVWELDHIEELHTFDLTDPIQFKQAVHYTNLQPLTIEDHIKKTTEQRQQRNRKNF